MAGILMWLMGVPLVVIVLLIFCSNCSGGGFDPHILQAAYPPAPNLA